jgi:2,5-diketo-D-gluconate reductase B
MTDFKLPMLGLGTFPLKGEEATQAVLMGLEHGMRHVDTAQMYGNELAVGRALGLSGLAREELCIVTKVDPSNLSEGRFSNSVKRSIADLGGPVDVLLIHWPPADKEVDGVIDRLQQAQADGLTKQIGVSNFPAGLMRRAQQRTRGRLVCNQVEFHPLLDQRKLLSVAQELGTQLTAYSPLARGRALEPQAVLEVGSRHGRPASEIVLRWIIQQGVAAIPMTTKVENLKSNMRALDFALSETDMVALAGLARADGRMINPADMHGRWDA